jgi:hypothetical protein
MTCGFMDMSVVRLTVLLSKRPLGIIKVHALCSSQHSRQSLRSFMTPFIYTAGIGFELTTGSV